MSLLGLLVTLGRAAPDGPATLTPEQQVEDFDALWADLDRTHPSLTLYTDAEALQAVRADVRARLTETRPSLEVWGLLMESVSAIGCGHTGVDFGIDQIRGPVVDGQMFPVDLVVVDGVLHADPRADGPRGRIVSADGMPGDELLTRLRRLTGGDGGTTHSADTRIDVLSPVLATAVLGARDVHEVVLERDGTEQVEHLRGVQRFHSVGGTEPRTDEEGRAEVRLVDLHTGAVRHPRDGVDGAVVHATFDEFPRRGRLRRQVVRPVLRLLQRGAAGLVVDLRWNGGGDPRSAMDLYGHLIEAPEPSYSLKAMRPEVWEELGWWKDGVPTPDGLLDAGYGRHDTIVPREPRYDGPVVILTSGDTFSTAADLAAFGKRNGRATVIGTPTGGSATIQTSGATWEERLPNSRMAYSIPLSRSVLADPDGRLAGHVGVKPDILAWATLEDLAAGRDVALPVALQHIRERASGPPGRR